MQPTRLSEQIGALGIEHRARRRKSEVRGQKVNLDYLSDFDVFNDFSNGLRTTDN